MDDDVVSTAVLDRTARLPERDRRRWLAVVALGIGAFAIGTDMFAMAGMLGGISRDLGVTVGAAGLTVTVFALAYAIGAVLLSALLGSWPLRRVLIGSAALFGILSALSAVAPALPALLATRVLGALAASVYVPAACAAAVAAVPASHRGRALSVILGGTATAMVLGAPLGVALASRLSWRAAFGLVVVLAGATVIALLLTRAGAGPLTRATVRERLRPMRSPAVVGLIGLGAGSAPLLLALNSSAIHLGSAAGALSGGLVVDTAGVGSLWMIAVACCGAGLAVHGILGREVLA
ncbi:MFS transporter [Nonomuraea dietziae]|uniref:MFS transporter n=1 Tax=Nonomuraea dietziae TaxID=65515 RepID=UPI00341C6B05